ncbi:MAG: hypothetical protein H0T62_03770 [Parachlamydiaceae bacterium]|nr:hypothetical protein [Parachlamydiaceae bacterium]
MHPVSFQNSVPANFIFLTGDSSESSTEYLDTEIENYTSASSTTAN